MEASVKLVRVFFGIATVFLEHFRAGGGGVVWQSREYIVLMGYFGYCGSSVHQPQCVACSVAGVIS